MKKNISFNDDQKEVFRFVIIVAVIALIVLVIYLASYFATKKNVYHYDTSKEGEVSTDVVTIGTMFNKDEEEALDNDELDEDEMDEEDDDEDIYYDNDIDSDDDDDDDLKDLVIVDEDEISAE